jgi:hypothetical protein
MKYSTHGHLTVDLWRQLTTPFEMDTQTPFQRAFKETVKQVEAREESKLIPTIAGFVAVAGVYAAAGILIVGDGPLPFGDVIAVGLLAIPDALIFAFGYSLADYFFD